ncbi:FliH/SctL family protein [Ramlibacter sp. 2FC]|uniref:FliH/SctL family protein n=1 Tax=Ramlibacter sp. 2FC TaxID=2502188 RepID=UPI0010F4B6FE|nr:FliH/SctL family protein [Ramlibacter sp. 2FC]
MSERRPNRFIPREELRAYVAWKPGNLGERDRVPPADAAPDALAAQALAAQQAMQMQALREAAHEEGYREGLQALEAFKQAHAAEAAARMEPLLAALQSRLAGLEQGLAAQVAVLATEIARQVVHHELATRPELIEAVAQDALAALVHSARQLRIRLHPEDREWLVAQGSLDLASRQAVLLADPGQARGGCVVESDIAGVDASVPARWRRVLAALGLESPWRAADPSARSGA